MRRSTSVRPRSLLLGPCARSRRRRAAAAHVDGTMGYATVSLHGGTVRYRLTLGIDALEARRRDADLRAGATMRCRDIVARKVSIAADGSPASGPGRGDAAVAGPRQCRDRDRLRLPWPSRTSSRLRDNLSDAFGPGHHSLTNIEAPGGAQPSPGAGPAEARVALRSRAADRGVLPGFDGSGLWRSSGSARTYPDRLRPSALPACALLGGGRLGSLLAIVTAFTLAHSITLALAVLDVWRRRPGWSTAIALSIVYVAAENTFSSAAPRRWAVSFGFGLAHGFGFAGALLELELPRASWSARCCHSISVLSRPGVVIGILVPTLVWLRRFDWEQRAVTTLSTLVLTAGLALLLERVLLTAG